MPERVAVPDWQQAMLPLMPPSPLAPSVGGVVQAQRTAQPDARVCVLCKQQPVEPGSVICVQCDWTLEPLDGERSER